MTQDQYFKNLSSPEGKIDIVLDTDAYNEIDDQFAISYMLKQPKRFVIKGICAAPFLNGRSSSPENGMEKSYSEILKLLELADSESLKTLVYKGSATYLPNEKQPVESDAASFMASLSNDYSPKNPLYIVAIGAITNVASAILKNPNMIENCVVVWLGGHAHHFPAGACEFNMVQDIAAARVVFGSKIPLVQLPCNGVVDRFAISKYELEHWLKGKNRLCDYLYQNTVNEGDRYAKDRVWSRAIWDVTAVAWILNDKQRFMSDCLVASPIPEYDKEYAHNPKRHLIRYVYHIKRDALFQDLFRVLGA